jgi:hypothetical protein
MQTIGDLLNSVQKLDVPYLISESLIDSRDEYIRLQREQMREGLTRSGGHIISSLERKGNPPPDEYSYSYRRYKGKAFPIDLYDKGNFQNDIFLKIDDSETFTVDSADSKSGKIQEVFGTSIFGLNDESKVELIPIVQQNLYNDLINALSK